jgi:hypothetical protein
MLGTALLVLGLGNGALDVSMNTHAVQVEARYGRPIMSAFHAVYSVGGLLAALLGARTISWGWSLLATMSTSAFWPWPSAQPPRPASCRGRSPPPTRHSPAKSGQAVRGRCRGVSGPWPPWP